MKRKLFAWMLVFSFVFSNSGFSLIAEEEQGEPESPDTSEAVSETDGEEETGEIVLETEQEDISAEEEEPEETDNLNQETDEVTISDQEFEESDSAEVSEESEDKSDLEGIEDFAEEETISDEIEVYPSDELFSDIKDQFIFFGNVEFSEENNIVFSLSEADEEKGIAVYPDKFDCADDIWLRFKYSGDADIKFVLSDKEFTDEDYQREESHNSDLESEEKEAIYAESPENILQTVDQVNENDTTTNKPEENKLTIQFAKDHVFLSEAGKDNTSVNGTFEQDNITDPEYCIRIFDGRIRIYRNKENVVEYNPENHTDQYYLYCWADFSNEEKETNILTTITEFMLSSSAKMDDSGTSENTSEQTEIIDEETITNVEDTMLASSKPKTILKQLTPKSFNSVYEENQWIARFASKIWMGEYDGTDGNVPVRRRYALQITDVSLRLKTFEGIGYVDKLNDDAAQLRLSYKLQGSFDYENNTITWQGYEFIESVDGFRFVKFTASVDDSFRALDGSTTAYAGSTVNLHAASGKYTGTFVNDDGLKVFDYDPYTFNADLANECMENNLLIYGDSVDLGTGYYSERKEIGLGPLREKLKQEGFEYISIDNGKPIHSGTDKDGYHWIYATQELSDGSLLVYVIFQGTVGDEWYGDFNVTGPGDTYTGEENVHYSFHKGAESVLNDIKAEIIDKEENAGKTFRFVVTGHSRGAAGANLLAKKLTDEDQIVYAYTFATPAVAKKDEIAKEKSENGKEYNNIFNFCLNDDFVTYMPLADSNWQYGRYGKTYYNSAAVLFSKNSFYRSIVTTYEQSFNSGDTNYKRTGAYNLADKLNEYCLSVEQFYEKTHERDYVIEDEYNQTVITEMISWYDFFQMWFAPLLKGNVSVLLMNNYVYDPEMSSIQQIFLAGGAGYALGNYSSSISYLGNTHDPKSYYAWTMCLKDGSVGLTDMDNICTERDQLAAKYPKTRTRSLLRTAGSSDHSSQDEQVMKTFASQGNNAALLGWNLDDSSSWDGVKWNENGHIESVDIAFRSLTGTLDVSGLAELKVLDCAGNSLTGLNIGTVELEELYCEANYLETAQGTGLKTRIDELTENGNFNTSYSPQYFGNNIQFSESEINALRSFIQQEDNQSILQWDLENPDDCRGLIWERSGNEAHVAEIHLPDMNLDGRADFENMPFLRTVDLRDNNLTDVNLSGNRRLEKVDISDNLIDRFVYDNCPELKILFCSHNFMSEETIRTIRVSDQSENIYIEYDHQFKTAPASLFFDENEISVLKELLKNTSLEIDWRYPGMAACFDWVMIDNCYYLRGIDLSDTDIQGSIDLTPFAVLENINFQNTAITEIKLPGSVEVIGESAFAECSQLTDLYVMDNWSDCEADAFRNCGQLTIHGLKSSFADIYCRMMNIAFEEESRPKIDIKSFSCADGTAYEGGTYYPIGCTLSFNDQDGNESTVYHGFTAGEFDQYKTGGQYIDVYYIKDDVKYKMPSQQYIEVCPVRNGIAYREENGNYSVAGITDYDRTAIVVPSKVDGKKVTSVSDYAFYKNAYLKNVTLPSGITDIGAYAFRYCLSLERISIPESVTKIGQYAFGNNYELTDVSVPASVKEIGYAAFSFCENLGNITFEGYPESIDDFAFFDCSSLKSIILPDGLKSIGASAFADCTSLEKLVFPESAEELGYPLFQNNSNLKTAGPIGSGSNIEYGWKEEIPENAFANLRNLESIILPDELTSIGDGAFAWCQALKSVDLPQNLSVIGEDAFIQCKALTSIAIPENVTSVGDYAFNSCSNLETITIPSSISVIGDHAFYDCEKLKDVYYDGSETGWNMIAIDSCNGTLYSANIHYLRSSKPKSISLNTSFAELPADDHIRLVLTPNPGKADMKAIWTSSNEKAAVVDSSGKVTAKGYGKTTITAVSVSNPNAKATCTIQTRFNDVNDSTQYYYKPVYWGADNGIVTGFNGGEYFGPQQTCTRAQFVIFIWRIAGKPASPGTKVTFSDISGNENYFRALQWAVSRKIIGGYKDGTFKPDRYVSRCEVSIMLWKFAGRPSVNISGKSPFTDINLNNASSENTYRSVIWGQKAGVIKGYKDGTFQPNGDCLREHIVTFLYRYVRDVMKRKV